LPVAFAVPEKSNAILDGLVIRKRGSHALLQRVDKHAKRRQGFVVREFFGEGAPCRSGANRIAPLQSGRNVVALLMVGAVLPMEALSPPPTRLQIVACDATDDGGIDLALSNSGTAAALVTRIELEVLALRPTTVRPSLPVAASYRIEMKAPRPGSRHAVVVRHVILPKALERIVLVPQTNRAMRVRLRLFAADGAVMTRDVELWAGAQ